MTRRTTSVFLFWLLAAAAALAEAGAERGRIEFFGSDTAVLFSREVSDSFDGVLGRNFVASPDGPVPAGFLNASPKSQPWYGSMWTRDAGAFLRELVAWGDYGHARMVARCLMGLGVRNRQGFIAYPRYFAPAKNIGGSGTELDGHDAIVIALVMLEERLPAQDPFRAELYGFLHQPSSPVRWLDFELGRGPLIPGTGEFGAGGPQGLVDNVVQNNLSALALLKAAEMESAAGDRATAGKWRGDARLLFKNIHRHLVGADGGWIWCIDPQTLRPDPAVLGKAVNVGFGGLNGVAAMDADVLGFDPDSPRWPGLRESEATFQHLLDVPLRYEQFERYGIWTQFDRIHHGLLTSPSYGQGYALQAMLLFDKLAMAGHGLDFLANATFKAEGVTFPQGRLSPYYFYERLYSPEEVGKEELASGCGPLNLVNVAEPLKVARLLAGVDDTAPEQVRIIPRLPPGWRGYRLSHWPILTKNGVVRADLSFEQVRGRSELRIEAQPGETIRRISVRLPTASGYLWRERQNVRVLDLKSDADESMRQ